MTLAEVLGRYYRASVISKDPGADTTLATVLNASPTLRAEAEAEMKRLNDLGARGNLAQRCFVSHIYLSGLTKALAPTP